MQNTKSDAEQHRRPSNNAIEKKRKLLKDRSPQILQFEPCAESIGAGYLILSIIPQDAWPGLRYKTAEDVFVLNPSKAQIQPRRR